MRSLILLLALPSLVAAAPEAVAPCPATSAPLAAPLTGWVPGVRVTAGTAAADVPPLTLAGRADVALADDAGVHYVVTPGKSGAAGSKGGLLAFLVTRAGTYRVALGTAAWVDVIGNGTSIASTAHGRGPACSGIRKMVDFALAPGAYVLQISGSGDPVTGVMVTPLP